MTNPENPTVDKKFVASAMAAFLQIGAVFILLLLCFELARPFLPVVVWAIVISVAAYPMYQALAAKFGGRKKLSATIIALVGTAIVVVPMWSLGSSTFGALKKVGNRLEAGTASVPPPNESVAEWPLIGDKAYALWSAAAEDLDGTLQQFQPEFSEAGKALLGLAGHTAITALLFLVSILIAVALFSQAESGKAAAKKIARNLAGEWHGDSMVELSIATIRSVVKGVLGVAVIQAVLAAIGLVIMGVPAAGIWAGLVLVLAIIQLPPILILLPIAIWVFSVASPVPATIFLVYSLLVSASDAFLKPMLLGRGLETPMLVILIGALGGAMALGIIGLFVGAVVLSIGYQLLRAWMTMDQVDLEPGAA